MEHNISELVRINGKKGIYDDSYCDKYGIFPFETTPLQKYTADAELTIHTANGITTIYMLGEETFFMTEYDRSVVRERMKKEELMQRKRAALNKLSRLSVANLEKLVEKLGL